MSEPGEYVWDFCTGELNGTPSAEMETNVTGATGRPGIELIKDGGSWFGFVSGTFTNTLHRLEFGNGIGNEPTQVVNLGDLGGLLNNPGQIRIIRETGQWYGILHNAGAGQLLKLEFPGGLSGQISTSLLASDVGTINAGIALGNDSVHGWICVSSNSENGFTILRLGNDLSEPGPSDIITTPAVPNANNLGDVDLINDCGNWYGAAANFGGGNVYVLKFGDNLFSIPQIDQVASLPVSNNGRLRFARDGEEYFLFITALDGVLNKLQFGSDLGSMPDIVDEGDIQGVLQANTYGLALVRENSIWTILSISQSDGKLYRIEYDQACDASPPTSNETAPIVSYGSNGTFHISLENTVNGSSQVATKTIEVSTLRSPDIAFSTENICINSDVNFLTQNSSGDIQSYDWDFGDATSHASGANPTHQYTGTGEFKIELSVTATNGCMNVAAANLFIYPQPVANFTLPSALLCTNNQLTIENSTADVFDGNLTYEWLTGSTTVATSRDLIHTFTDTGPQTIKLIASIPGCSDEVEKVTSPFLAGPTIDFSFQGKCESEEISFSSLIAETVTDHTWNFDDGTIVNDIDPQHIFAVVGVFAVALTATSVNGCNNTTTKPVPIFSKPDTDFEALPPPQSCSGEPTPFFDLTPGPPDSELAAWSWDFGDPNAPETTEEQDPHHTFPVSGDYIVALTVTTDQGCSATVEEEITIYPSPSVNISNSAACLDQSASFDATGDNIESFYWEIGTSYYETSSFQHTFHATGDHSVTLTIVGDNNCISFYDNQITVPEPLIPAWSVRNNCSGFEALFTDLTTGVDPVEARFWNFDGDETGTGATAEHIFNSTGQKNVVLQVTAASGCVYTTSKIIEIAAPPVASFSASPSIGAAPLKVQFTNTSPAGTDAEWNFGDGGTSLDHSPVYVYEAEGRFVAQLRVTNAEGCASVADHGIVSEEPRPDVRVNLVTITTNPDGSIKVISTLENKGNTVIEGLPVRIDISGTSSLIQIVEGPLLPATLTNVISDFSIVAGTPVPFICVETALPDDLFHADDRYCAEFASRLVLLDPHPNPVVNELKVEWISPDGREVDILLSDSFGRRISHSRLLSAKGLNQVIIDVNRQHGGIYFLTLKSQSTFETRRILIGRQN